MLEIITHSTTDVGITAQCRHLVTVSAATVNHQTTTQEGKNVGKLPVYSRFHTCNSICEQMYLHCMPDTHILL